MRITDYRLVIIVVVRCLNIINKLPSVRIFLKNHSCHRYGMIELTVCERFARSFFVLCCCVASERWYCTGR